MRKSEKNILMDEIKALAESIAESITKSTITVSLPDDNCDIRNTAE